jgi:hypothetical protein
MRFRKFLPFILIGSIALVSSCIKKDEYSPVPSIEFKDFVKRGTDSADFIITFKDGDGDIGLNQWDTTGSYSSTSPYYYNLVMKYFYKKSDGTFEQFVLPGGDTLVYSYRMPDITPQGQNKALSGEIMVNMLAPYYYPGHTTIRFDVYIYDRELNKSNVVTTPEIIVP